MSDNEAPKIILARWLLEDANARLRFQQEFSLGGFRTLILVNGGAIIGLLTYAGNKLDPARVAGLSTAFEWYVVGLAATTLAYVFAYYAQGRIMDNSSLRGVRLLGLAEDEKKSEESEERYAKIGTQFIIAAVILAVLSLACFLVGSLCAMRALT